VKIVTPAGLHASVERNYLNHKKMKTTTIFFLVMFSMKTMAQFPSPSNFEFSYKYFNTNQWGYCDSQLVYGPAYCSNFQWVCPDTSGTDSQLDYYNIYYYDYFSGDTSIIASVGEVNIEMVIGIIGEVWVTAVYSNPEGESSPSNKIINEDLPMSIDENAMNGELDFYYNQINQTINFSDPSQIKEIKIIDIQGKTLKLLRYPEEKVSLNDLITGCYFIEVITKNSNSFREKIIK
jgi:hypothetical protein